jgi:peptidoglycan hydrolase-like protein with peptidoglycan-binding domain
MTHLKGAERLSTTALSLQTLRNGGTRMLLRRVAGTLAAVVAAGVMVATPSHATGAAISGTNDPLDDWGDEYIVSQTSYNNSNVTAMWQQILWAEGYLEWADIDCQFGPNTTAASKKWQADHGLDPDGLIGRNTWTVAAQEHLQMVSPTTLRYNGYADRYINFQRPEAGGNWSMSISGDWEVLWYGQSTFTKCAA